MHSANIIEKSILPFKSLVDNLIYNYNIFRLYTFFKRTDSAAGNNSSYSEFFQCEDICRVRNSRWTKPVSVAVPVYKGNPGAAKCAGQNFPARRTERRIYRDFAYVLKLPLQDIAMDREGHPQVALGQGSIDWVKTFTAAKVGGVKNYFVEQTWELTQQSVAYLKTLEV